MTHEQFEREKQYAIIMTLADSMRKSGALLQEEYKILDTFFRERYQPIRTFSLEKPASDRVECATTGGESIDYYETG